MPAAPSPTLGVPDPVVTYAYQQSVLKEEVRLGEAQVRWEGSDSEFARCGVTSVGALTNAMCRAGCAADQPVAAVPNG